MVEVGKDGSGKRGFGGRLPEKEVPTGVAREGGDGVGMDKAGTECWIGDHVREDGR